jgi:hypothetical protein
MADKVINVDIITNTTGVKSLKTELRETIQLLQQTTDPKQFEALSEKAAQLKDRMAEVNESVNALATGSKYEKVTKAFGEMGAGLRDMDFDRVVSGSKLFAQSAKAITFKDAIGSVKQMGSVLLTVGKAILTNPLFLIAGVVTLIVVGIVKLMDKLGILKKIFDFVGGAIDAVKKFMGYNEGDLEKLSKNLADGISGNKDNKDNKSSGRKTPEQQAYLNRMKTGGVDNSEKQRQLDSNYENQNKTTRVEMNITSNVNEDSLRTNLTNHPTFVDELMNVFHTKGSYTNIGK